MKKMFFLAATTALALSSCSSEDVASENVVDNGLVPVTFDAPYLTSRAASDKLELDGLQTRGFGVFAYEQGTLAFDQYYPTALAPNFMNNQKVMGYTSANEEITNVANFDHWGYTPVKYWSNNDGAKASFFAYAPWGTATTPSTKILKDASTTQSPRLVLHGRYNGPAVYYKVPETLAEGIDLCWGDFNNTGHAAVDLSKQAVGDNIKFNFKHALSRVNFNAQLWVNQVRPEGNPDIHENETTSPSETLAAGTTITIKSLKLVGNMATEGYLRLSDGKWDAQVSATKTLEMGDYFAGGADGTVACKYIMKNEVAEQELFGAADNYFMTIPGGSFKVQVEYEVHTIDGNLGTEGYTRTVKQISEQPYTLEAGKSYQFHLNLGMTSAKFTAEVSNWSEEKQEEIDLPANFPTVTSLDATPVASISTLPTGPLTDGMYWYDATNSKLKKYNTSLSTPDWEVVAAIDCPRWISNSGNYYEHIAGGVSYNTTAISIETSIANLEDAKKDAVNKNANGYYTVTTPVSGTYYIQVK